MRPLCCYLVMPCRFGEFGTPLFMIGLGHPVVRPGHRAAKAVHVPIGERRPGTEPPGEPSRLPWKTGTWSGGRTGFDRRTVFLELAWHVYVLWSWAIARVPTPLPRNFQK